MAVTKEEIIEALKEMPALELSELVHELEDVFGVSAAAPVAVAAAPAAADAAPAEEKTNFDVELTSFGSNKIAVIKVVRPDILWSEGGQGCRRSCSQGHHRGGQEGGRRSRQEAARGGWCRGHPQVACVRIRMNPGTPGSLGPGPRTRPFVCGRIVWNTTRCSQLKSMTRR